MSAPASPPLSVWELEGLDAGAKLAWIGLRSPAQARGIAFGHRFTDDDPDPEWLSAARAKHASRYVAGSCR